MPSTLTLRTPDDFDFVPSVCSYGFYVLAPNRWDADTQTLHTVVRGERASRVPVRVSASAGRVTIRSSKRLSDKSQRAVKQQVARMLRLDEDIEPFHAVHRDAKRTGFGRLFRSATLFEDIVKTMTTCNVAWSSSVNMNRLMCEHVGLGGFPTPRQLAAVEPEQLKQICRVGYRAERIVRLARDVDRGALDLATFEDDDRPTNDLAAALVAIHGIGPYAANNLLQILGRHERVPVDSEVVRHFKERKATELPSSVTAAQAIVDEHYAAWSPYQFLAYWFELWRGYDQDELK